VQQGAQQALYWGEPVMDSMLTLISDGDLFYRGHSVADLVRTATFEEVCGLLWLDDPAAGETLFAEPRQQPEINYQSVETSTSALVRMQMALAQAAEHDLQAYDHSPQNIARIGVRILRQLVAAAVGSTDSSQASTAQTLAEEWRMTSSELIQASLILWADHELNVSAFTARAIASADASPYQAVIGALAALQGYRHGGATQHVETMLQTFAASADRQNTMRRWLQGGQPLAGFGHHLYPNGDPRARLMLDLLFSQQGAHLELELAEQVMAFAQQSTGRLPNIDFAIVVLQRLFNLPPDAGITLFAIGRTAGWIAHIIEQYAVDTLIRPRATYTGRMPL
jgi:citrate synthase